MLTEVEPGLRAPGRATASSHERRAASSTPPWSPSGAFEQDAAVDHVDLQQAAEAGRGAARAARCRSRRPCRGRTAGRSCRGRSRAARACRPAPPSCIRRGDRRAGSTCRRRRLAVLRRGAAHDQQSPSSGAGRATPGMVSTARSTSPSVPGIAASRPARSSGVSVRARAARRGPRAGEAEERRGRGRERARPSGAGAGGGADWLRGGSSKSKWNGMCWDRGRRRASRARSAGARRRRALQRRTRGRRTR